MKAKLYCTAATHIAMRKLSQSRIKFMFTAYPYDYADE